MAILSELFNTVSQIMNIKMNLFGYSVSFLNIFAFAVIAVICGVCITKLFNL